MKKVEERKKNIKRLVVPTGAAVAMVMAVQAKDVWAEEFDTEEMKDQQEVVETIPDQAQPSQEITSEPSIEEPAEEAVLRTANASTEVEVGGMPEDFAAPLPISEVGLDYAALSEGVTPTITGDFTIHDQYQVSYDKGQTGHSTIAAEGTITYRYEGAATLADKSKADVVITISDVVFTVGGQQDSQLPGRMLVSQNGTRIRASVLDASGGPLPWAYNIRMSYTIQIEGADGAFVLPIQGLNQDRSGGSWTNLRDIDPTLVQERLSMLDGTVDYVYVIEEWKTGYEKEGSTLTFFGKSNGAGDQNYNSGLVFVGDAAGISFDLHETGAANNRGVEQPNTIYVRLGGLSHYIDSSTGNGGTIQTTLGSNSKSSNASGLLDDDRVLDPGFYSIPDGKNVTYTMTPDSGYTLKTVTVDGQTITPEEHTKADGSKYWTYTFEYNMDNHEIHVDWLAEYKITYDANGGTGTMEEQDFLEDDDSMMSKDNTFTKEKRKYKGFYGYVIDPETGKETQIVDDSGEPILFESAADMKQYFDGQPGGTEIRMEAQWTYTVTYIDEWTGRTIQETISVDDKDPEPAAPADPTREGYTFDYWEKEEDNEGNIVYKAQWKRTVVYDDAIDDSIYMPSTTLTNDEGEPESPSDPTKPGYTFTGWARTEDDKGNIRYTAQWQRTVIYDDAIDDSIYMPSTTLTNDEGEPESPEDPTKPGYTFTGWARTEDDKGNIRYTAQWQRTVIYDDAIDDSIYMPSTTLTNDEGEPESPSDPTKPGYTFTGWARTEDDKGNIRYTAQWQRTVIYDDAIDDSIYMPSTTLTNDEAEPESPSDPTKPGYTFTGWARTEDDKGNIRYTAQWQRTVIYDDAIDDSIYMPSTTLTNDEAEPESPSDPTKPGYTFTGWARTEDEYGNIRYTAQWRRTVIYDDAIDDTIYIPCTTLTNDEAEPATPADPVKEGYTFTGWGRISDDSGNIRYTAQWKRTVKYIDLETGTVYMVETPFFNNEPEPTGPTQPTKEGYTFVGWNRTMDSLGNIVYEAMWEIIPVEEESEPEEKVEPKTERKEEIKVDPIVQQGRVQTDVHISMGVWSSMMVAAQAVLAMFVRKKDEE